MPEHQLVCLAEKILPYPIQRDLLAYHPRTELIAVVAEHGDIDIYRSGGQRAIHIPQKDIAGTVNCLQWQPEGDYLFVGTSEGQVERISVRTGRVVVQVEELNFTALGARTTDEAPVVCLGASINLIHTKEVEGVSSSQRTSVSDNGQSTDEWFKKISRTDPPKATGNVNSLDVKSAATDLPQHLASLDIDAILPRLSVIPAPSKNQHGFQPKSTKTAAQKMVHGILNTKLPRDSSIMHTIFAAHEDGKARLVLDRIFDQQFTAPSGDNTQTPIKHCSHTSSPYHVLVRARKQTDADTSQEGTALLSDVNLALYEVPFSARGGLHTRTIINKSLQFHCLGLYLGYCVDYMTTEWNTNTMLPSRFIENINETLTEKGEAKLEQHLYRLAMTGYRDETLTEWLKDELAERGHKRWDQAMTTLHHSLSHIFRTNIIPGMERLTLAASALRGLALYYEGTTKFDVEAQFFTKVIDTVGCLQLLVHEALQVLGDEERQFRAFSRWLRAQVDLSATEPGSQSAQELSEREAMTADIPRVLSYLEGPLIQSRLEPFVKASGAESLANTGHNVEVVAASIKAARATPTSDDVALSIPACMKRLQELVETAFGQIKQWQKSTWSRPVEQSLNVATASAILDARIIANPAVTGISNVVDVLLKDEDENQLLVRSLDISNGATKSLLQQRQLIFDGDTSILDAQTMLDASVLILLEQAGDAFLVRLPWAYVFGAGTGDIYVDDNALNQWKLHAFDGADNFAPAHIWVDETKARRVVVLDKTRRAWRILDLGRRTDMVGTDVAEEDEGEEEHDGAEDSMVF
ncbi:hypothetical protein MBLNU457_1471t1 [Dothideomycetes sp. NU457]